MKQIILAAIIALAPAAGMAMCKHGHQSAMSCAEGSAWSDEEKACLPVASS